MKPVREISNFGEETGVESAPQAPSPAGPIGLKQAIQAATESPGRTVAAVEVSRTRSTTRIRFDASKTWMQRSVGIDEPDQTNPGLEILVDLVEQIRAEIGRADRLRRPGRGRRPRHRHGETWDGRWASGRKKQRQYPDGVVGSRRACRRISKEHFDRKVGRDAACRRIWHLDIETESGSVLTA